MEKSISRRKMTNLAEMRKNKTMYRVRRYMETKYSLLTAEEYNALSFAEKDALVECVTFHDVLEVDGKVTGKFESPCTGRLERREILL